MFCCFVDLLICWFVVCGWVWMLNCGFLICSYWFKIVFLLLFVFNRCRKSFKSGKKNPGCCASVHKKRKVRGKWIVLWWLLIVNICALNVFLCEFIYSNCVYFVGGSTAASKEPHHSQRIPRQRGVGFFFFSECEERGGKWRDCGASRTRRVVAERARGSPERWLTCCVGDVMWCDVMWYDVMWCNVVVVFCWCYVGVMLVLFVLWCICVCFLLLCICVCFFCVMLYCFVLLCFICCIYVYLMYLCFVVFLFV